MHKMVWTRRLRVEIIDRQVVYGVCISSCINARVFILCRRDVVAEDAHLDHRQLVGTARIRHSKFPPQSFWKQKLTRHTEKKYI